jgi:general secretion pathway protein G
LPGRKSPSCGQCRERLLPVRQIVDQRILLLPIDADIGRRSDLYAVGENGERHRTVGGRTSPCRPARTRLTSRGAIGPVPGRRGTPGVALKLCHKVDEFRASLISMSGTSRRFSIWMYSTSTGLRIIRTVADVTSVMGLSDYRRVRTGLGCVLRTEPMAPYQLRRTVLAIVLAVSVVAVLGYLLGSQYLESRRFAREQALKSHLFLMRDAIDKYRAETGKCPASLQAMVDARYLRAIPTDPFTSSSTEWRYDGAQVCDVKSVSVQLAKDGSRYADW